MASGIFYQTPNQTSALADAVLWIEGVLTGSIGTSIAVLAVAGIGFAMLQGRLSARAGLRVVLGCFILFGAPAIAQGLIGSSRGSGHPIAIPTPAPLPNLPPAPAPKQNTDPYAGASVPM